MDGSTFLKCKQVMVNRECITWFRWHSPRRLTAIALRFRSVTWSVGASHSVFVRAWSFGPFIIARTNLDRP